MNAPAKEISTVELTLDVKETTNLATAVCSVMAEIKRLEKADENKFANYKFVSVDDFKDAVRPLMAKHGLSPHVDEKVFRIEEFEATLKNGTSKKSTVAVFKYAITLYHKSGESSKPERATVALPFVGAQTSGIAKSYAIKEWFKSRFLASAGDQQEEADLMGEAEDMRLSKKDGRALYDDLQKEMNAIVSGRDHVALRDWWQVEYYRIQTLPKDWEITFKTVWITEGKSLKAQADLDKMSNEEMDKMAVEHDDLDATALLRA